MRMKRRLRYNWQTHQWHGVLLSPAASARLAALDSVSRDRFIANIVVALRCKEDTKYRRTARFRMARA